MKELAEQAIVHVVNGCCQMARVMHMVGTLHAIDSRTGHYLVAVYPRE